MVIWNTGKQQIKENDTEYILQAAARINHLLFSGCYKAASKYEAHLGYLRRLDAECSELDPSGRSAYAVTREKNIPLKAYTYCPQ
jgi:hypothetical protein